MRFRGIALAALFAVLLVSVVILWPAGPPGLNPEPAGTFHEAGSEERAVPAVTGVAMEPPVLISDAHLDLAHAVRLEVPEVPDEAPRVAAPTPPEEKGIEPLPEPEPVSTPDTPEREPQDAPEPVREGPLISPVLLQAAWVSYPAGALRKKVEGPVEVRVRVEEDGGVSAVEVVSASPDTSLNRAAVESALSMKFKPATQSGRPVTVWYNYRFDFKLPRS